MKIKLTTMLNDSINAADQIRQLLSHTYSVLARIGNIIPFDLIHWSP